MRLGRIQILAAAITALALALFAYKVVVLGFPLAPDEERTIWTLQARFTVDAQMGPVTATLQIPQDPPGFTVLDENFISRGFGLNVSSSGRAREARWAIRDAEGRQTLYYRAAVVKETKWISAERPPLFPDPPQNGEPFDTALRTVVNEVQAHSADVASFTAELLRLLNDPTPDENVGLFLADGRSAARKAEVAVQFLAGARIPARILYGLRLADRQRFARFVPWLEVHDGNDWLQFDPAGSTQGLPADFFVWWRGSKPLVQVQGADNPEVDISSWRTVGAALEIAERRADQMGSRVVEFSLLGLPVQTQAVYSVLLLIPLGAFIMVILRNVVGFKTFGTFMPVLVALSFRETNLVWGIALFTLVVAVGLALRFMLERLHLLLVPRLAAVLILVVLSLVSISILSHRLGLETGLSVALFPLVILTIAIERMSVVWEERGPGEALQEGGGTLAVACLAHLVMSHRLIEHLVFVFPELLLVIFAATLLLGRYSGYRLTELLRFRSLVGHDD